MKQGVVFAALESRRLFAAAAGPDVTWLDDGAVDRGVPNRFVGTAGTQISVVYGNAGATPQLRRYTADGRLASSFSMPGVERLGTDFTLDAQGRLLAISGGTPLTVRRYTVAGQPDTAFSGDGKVVLDSFTRDPHYKSDRVAAVTTDADGAFYLFRELTYYPDPATFENYAQTLAVTKLRADGTPDAAFGDNGSAILKTGGDGFLYVAAIHVDADGRVLVAYQDDGLVATRLRSDGTFDPRYGTGGTTNVAVTASDRSGIAMDAGGRIVVLDGSAGRGGYKNDRLVRIDTRGRVDKTFGTNGAAVLGGRNNGSVVIYPDGTLLAESTSVVQRFTADGLPLRGTGPRELRGVEDVVGVLADGTILGGGDPDSFYSTVSKVVTLPAAVKSNGGRLYLNGTTGDDVFRLRPGATANVVVVDYNGARFGQFAGITAAATPGNPAGVVAVLSDGNDTLLDRYFNDKPTIAMRVDGGPGNDSLYTGAGDDTINAGEGDDTVISAAGDDSLGSQNAGADVYDLGDGADYLMQKTGPVTVYGGGGRDRVYADNDASADRIDAGDGNDTVSTGGGRDTVYGGAGDDTLYVRGGNNYVVAGRGNDTVLSGQGDDTIYAGDVTGVAAAARNVIDGGLGRDRAKRESDNDRFSDIESMLA